MADKELDRRNGFRWSNALSVDAKANRLVLPDRVRLVHGQDSDDAGFYFVGCEQPGRLFLHDKGQHAQYIQDLMSLLAEGRSHYHLPKRSEVILSRIMSRFQRVSCDTQGRMTIPRELLDMAGITEKVVLVVLPARTEIWAEEAHLAFEAENSEEDILAELEALRAKVAVPAPVSVPVLAGGA